MEGSQKRARGMRVVRRLQFRDEALSLLHCRGPLVSSRSGARQQTETSIDSVESHGGWRHADGLQHVSPLHRLFPPELQELRQYQLHIGGASVEVNVRRNEHSGRGNRKRAGGGRLVW